MCFWLFCLEEPEVDMDLQLSLIFTLANATQHWAQGYLHGDEQRARRVHNRITASLTVSVLWVCQFASLVVFLWRLLISAECRLQLLCQQWWKDRRRERGGRENKPWAARKEEFVIGWEWFQMVEQSVETPRVLPPDPCVCWVEWTTVDKSSACSEKRLYEDLISF